MSHIRHASPWNLHRREEPPEHQAWKTNRADIQGPKVLWETKTPLLEGSHTVSLTSRSSGKTTVWKMPRLYVGQIYLLIWGINWRSRGQLWPSVQMEALVEATITLSTWPISKGRQTLTWPPSTTCWNRLQLSFAPCLAQDCANGHGVLLLSS